MDNSFRAANLQSKKKCLQLNPHHNSITHVLSKHKGSTWGFCWGSTRKTIQYCCYKGCTSNLTVFITFFLQLTLFHFLETPQSNF